METITITRDDRSIKKTKPFKEKYLAIFAPKELTFFAATHQKIVSGMVIHVLENSSPKIFRETIIFRKRY